MVVPNSTYLKLKIFGTRGVITVSTSFQMAYACKQAKRGLATERELGLHLVPK
jgi:hypothetical protein